MYLIDKTIEHFLSSSYENNKVHYCMILVKFYSTICCFCIFIQIICKQKLIDFIEVFVFLLYSALLCVQYLYVL